MAPYVTPITSEHAAAASATTIDVRLPQRIRDRMSRPFASVPSHGAVWMLPNTVTRTCTIRRSSGFSSQ